uniref:Uncharacterized protein n=1 Tax=Branchiostoma floridae TaxID=7739 RepID=C3XUF4_BRAFL|eukprot:XP_002612519.1 hypothetical protein BRAFLDRAFT_75359 [Branchiostoma floridae]
MASGAGKRKTRKPARYRDEDSVDVDSASALIAKMTSEVERLKSSLRDEQASLSNLTLETNTSVASSVKSSEDGDDGTDASSERDIARPSLKELSKLQQRAARQRHRDSLLGAPVMHTKSRGKSPCSKYQYGQCSHNSDHDSPFGMKLHKCKFCIKWRPTLPADYPASSCPYYKAKRDALMASQQSPTQTRLTPPSLPLQQQIINACGVRLPICSSLTIKALEVIMKRAWSQKTLDLTEIQQTIEDKKQVLREARDAPVVGGRLEELDQRVLGGHSTIWTPCSRGKNSPLSAGSTLIMLLKILKHGSPRWRC